MAGAVTGGQPPAARSQGHRAAPCRLAAFVLAAAMVCCVAASAAGWHPALTGPAAAACLVALAGCLLRLKLKGDRP